MILENLSVEGMTFTGRVGTSRLRKKLFCLKGTGLSVCMRTGKEAADLSAPSLVGAPCFSRGSWTSVQRKSVSFRREGFSPGFSRPSLKRIIKVELLCATLKALLPLLKQGTPTRLRAPYGFSRRLFRPV